MSTPKKRINNSQELTEWYEDKQVPDELHQALSVRIALRIFPLVFQILGDKSNLAIEQKSKLILQTFRACFISWVALKYKRRNYNILKASVDLSKLIENAEDPSHTALLTATACAKAAQSTATNTYLSDDIADVAEGAANLSVGDVWDAINADMNWLSEHNNKEIPDQGELIDQPLWLNEVRHDQTYIANFPPWVRSPFDSVKETDLFKAGGWEVILTWYRAILPNTQNSQPRSSFGQEIDIMIAELEDKFWDDEPNEVVAKIANILAINIKVDAVGTHSDEPTSNDELGRWPFAKALVERLEDIRQQGGDDGCAVNLHGPWGAGKTSILQMMKEIMVKPRKEGNPWIVVYFNAWQHARRNPPWWPLLQSVKNECQRSLRPVWCPTFFCISILTITMGILTIYLALKYQDFSNFIISLITLIISMPMLIAVGSGVFLYYHRSVLLYFYYAIFEVLSGAFRYARMGAKWFWGYVCIFVAFVFGILLLRPYIDFSRYISSSMRLEILILMLVVAVFGILLYCRGSLIHYIRSAIPEVLSRLFQYYRLSFKWFMWRLWADWLPVFLSILVVGVIIIFLLPQSILFEDLVGLVKKLDPVLKIVCSIIASMIAIYSFFVLIGRGIVFGSNNNAKFYYDLSQDELRCVVKLFKDIVKIVNRPICIVVDDLDRCNEDYVVDLLEGIQTSFRNKNVVYVIASDRTWIRSSFEKRYEIFKDNVIDDGQPLGYLFLEKIFQFSAPVPGMGEEVRRNYWNGLLKMDSGLEIKGDEFDESIQNKREKIRNELGQNITRSQIDKYLGTNYSSEDRAAATLELNASRSAEKEAKHLLSQFVDCLPDNPRVMKRMINSYAMYQAITLLEGRTTSPEILARWTILEQRFPALADMLIKYPKWVVYLTLKEDDVELEKTPEAIEPFLNSDTIKAVIGLSDRDKITEKRIREITTGSSS